MGIVLQGGYGLPLQGGGGISLLQPQGANNLQPAASGLSVQPAANGAVLSNPNAKIVQPAPPAQNTSNTSKTSNTGGTTVVTTPAASNYQDRSNDIAVNQGFLNNISGEMNTATGAVSDALNKISGMYNSDINAATDTYNTENTNNTQDLETNKQTALEDAVQGRQGLFGTLASLGALSGTGIDLANNAVRAGANQDLTTAADTYATNQSNLDRSYQQYKKEEQNGLAGAQQAAANDTEIAKNNVYKEQEGYLKNLIADYLDEGNKGQADTYTKQLTSLIPQEVATNVPQLSIGYTGGAWSSPTLSQYVGKANTTTVQSTPGAGRGAFTVPGLVASPRKQVA